MSSTNTFSFFFLQQHFPLTYKQDPGMFRAQVFQVIMHQSHWASFRKTSLNGLTYILNTCRVVTNHGRIILHDWPNSLQMGFEHIESVLFWGGWPLISCFAKHILAALLVFTVILRRSVWASICLQHMKLEFAAYSWCHCFIYSWWIHQKAASPSTNSPDRR